MNTPPRFTGLFVCCGLLMSQFSPISPINPTHAKLSGSPSQISFLQTQPVTLAASTITGTAFRDYNANGSRDSREPGLASITVTAYDSAGAQQGIATTSASGNYTLTAAGAGPYRIEFTNALSDLRPGPAGNGNGTTVQFVADGNSSNISVGYANPADYTSPSLDLAVVVYSAGNALSNTNSMAVVTHPYLANTDTGVGLKGWAKTSDVGSLLGLAYKRSTKELFGATFTKRGVGFGPGGIGAIYKMPLAGTPSVLVDLGSAAGSFSKPRDLNPDPPDFDSEAMSKTGKTGFGDLDISADEKTLWTINLANRSLYKIDIAAAEAGAGDVGATLIGTHPDPGCLTGVARPFALEVKDEVIYVGGVCTGELGPSIGTTDTVKAYVYTYTQSSGWGSQPALSFPLSYPVSCADVYAAYTPNKSCNRPGVFGSVGDWRSWYDDVPKRVGAGGYEFSSETSDGYVISPQPIFSDIEIDGTDMVLGLRDRFGDQLGWDDPGPGGIGTSPFGSKNLLTIAVADILRAGPDGAGRWTIETNASGTTFGPGQHRNDGSGPCNGSMGPAGQNCGEFYDDNFNPSPASGHDEIAIGALAQVEGAPETIATIYDPYRYQSAGTAHMSNANGARTRAYEIYRGGQISQAGSRLNKVNGLGDLEVLTDPAPIEIGNRVWRDINGNGLQDAGEPGIENVTIRLYRPGVGADCIAGNADDGAAIARAITDAKGEYYFKDGVGPDPQIDTVGLVNSTLCKLTPGATYSIRVDNADDYNLDEPLEGLALTERDDVIASPGGSDRVDSDAALVGRQGWITYILGSYGENDHTLDFGFVPGVSLGNQVWFDTDNDRAVDPDEVGVGGVTLTLFVDANASGAIDGLEVTPITTTTTNNAGFYLFARGLLPGDYAVCVAAQNFGAGGALISYHSSGITAAANSALNEVAPANINANADNTDDGARQINGFCANGVGSGLITLSNAEPTNEVPANAPATQPGQTPGVVDPVPNGNSNASVDFGFYQAKLGNLVWNDVNNNGLRDAAEIGFGSLPVRLFAEDGATEIPVGPDGMWGTPDDAPGGTTTLADGTYALGGLPQGSYVLRLVPPANYISSSGAGNPYEPAPDNDGEGATPPNRNNDDNGTLVTSGPFSGSIESKAATLIPGTTGTVNNALGQTDNTTLDFGLTRIVDPNAFSIGNRVWMDTGAGANTNNGVMDADERGLPGLTVTLLSAGSPILTTTTDAQGYYRFDGLTSGDYVVQVTLLPFFSPSDINEANPNLDGDINNNCVNNVEVAVRTNTITLEPGGVEPINETDVRPNIGQGAQDAHANMTVDCGLVLPPMSLGNQVFDDRNNNGLFDVASEVGINGVVLNLYVDLNNDGDVHESEFDAPMLSTTTAASGTLAGFYLFGKLPPGAYVVGIACSNFGAGGPLVGYVSSSGQAASKTGPFEPSGDVDDPLYDDDTLDTGTQENHATGNGASNTCISMLAMQLSYESEPTNIGSGNDNSGNPADGIADEEEEPLFDNDFVTADRNENLVLDFGVHKPYSLGNRVWLDKNDDGLMSSDEPGLPGVTVRLFSITSTLLATTTTNVQGYYRFDFLTPAEYIVEVENPINPNALPAAPTSAYMRSSSPNGSGDVDLDDNGNTATTTMSARPATRSSPISIGDATAGDSEPTAESDLEANTKDRASDARYNATVDFGFYEPMQLGSRVFNDENNDGKRVSGERNGVVSLTLKLYAFDATGNYTAPISITRPSTATATFSDYFFTDLAPGSYVVEIVPDPDLAGYVSSSGKPGALLGPYEGACPNIVNPNDGPGGGINNDDNGILRPDGRMFSCPFVLTNREENAQDSVINPDINNTLDFGIFRPLSLGNLVWHDLDDDGEFDSDELPIAGVQVSLYWDANNDGNLDAGEFAAPVMTTTTDVSGLYLFTALGAGNYVVDLDAANFAVGKPLNGFVSSDGAEGGATGLFEPAPDPDTTSAKLDNDDNGTRNPSGVRSQPVTLRPGSEPLREAPDNDTTTLDPDENLTVDFGVYKPFSVGNRVFMDKNGTQKLDAGELGVGVVTVRLYVSGTAEAIAETATDPNGYYRFDRLRAGNYLLEISPGAFYTDLGKVSPLVGYVSCGVDEANPNSNSDSNDNGLGVVSNRSTGIRSNTVTLGKSGIEPIQEADLISGTNSQGAEDAFANMTIDFCFYKLASLGNLVWLDANKDGKQTAGEKPIPGAVVKLLGPNNTVVATTTTDASGLYTFTQLVPGNYQVCFKLPTGYDFTEKGTNPTSSDDSNANPSNGCADAVALSSGENNPTLDVGVVPVKPQAVTLLRFEAKPTENAVTVEWTTGAEVDSFGFVLYRATSDNRASATRVTAQIIPAQGRSASYHFNDATAQPGKNYFYWLIEIERDGDQLEYGPAVLAAPSLATNAIGVASAFVVPAPAALPANLSAESIVPIIHEQAQPQTLSAVRAEVIASAPIPMAQSLPNEQPSQVLPVQSAGAQVASGVIVSKSASQKKEIAPTMAAPVPARAAKPVVSAESQIHARSVAATIAEPTSTLPSNDGANRNPLGVLLAAAFITLVVLVFGVIGFAVRRARSRR